MLLFALLLPVLTCPITADGYRILAVFPMASDSHVILADGIVRHLLGAGHEVTYITPMPRNNTPSNLRQIDVSENVEYAIKEEVLNLQNIIDKGPQMDFSAFEDMLAAHNNTFHHPRVKRLIFDPQERFDVVIGEWMYTELYAGFAAIFNAPFILVSTMDPHSLILRRIDQHTNPSYTADLFSSSIPPFTFLERAKQLFIQMSYLILFNFHTYPIENAIYNSIIPYIKHRGNEVPDYEELRYNASLVLGNSHVSMGSAMPLPQSYKPVGGYHIDTNIKPLPQDLQKIMDNAKHGVIYFSMGTMVKSKSLPDELKQKLVKMFGTLKQTIIWKFEEKLQGLPENLHIMKWAPQPSILAHPNCILFITHGGLLSSIETIYFGKPIIGIPAFADQYLNVARAVKFGFAKQVDLSYSMADNLKQAIAEVLGNPSYAKKVKELSFIYHHRPATPGQEVVHWVEHVIKTGGAPHLRSPALDVPFYQRIFLDFVAVILLVLYVLKRIIVKVVRIFRKDKVDSKKKLK